MKLFLSAANIKRNFFLANLVAELQSKASEIDEEVDSRSNASVARDLSPLEFADNFESPPTNQRPLTQKIIRGKK